MMTASSFLAFTMSLISLFIFGMLVDVTANPCADSLRVGMCCYENARYYYGEDYEDDGEDVTA